MRGEENKTEIKIKAEIKAENKAEIETEMGRTKIVAQPQFQS
jgi:hypothetical protein